MEIYEKLSKLRKEHGYSQEELSIQLKVSRQTISRWENGLTLPDSNNLINIANFFELDVNEFLNDINTLQKNNSENSKITFKKFYKFIIIIILSIILLSLIILIGCIIKRYLIIDNISKNFAYIYLQNNNIFLYSKNETFIDTITLEKSYYSEKNYCKNNILKKEYYKSNSDINLKNNPINLVRMEYRDNSDYYDINMIDKTYTKSLYTQGTDFYYNLTASTLDAKIYNEFNYMSNLKEKLSLALNINYEIKCLKGNEETDKLYLLKKVTDDKRNTIILTTSAYNSNYFLDLEIENYDDNMTKIKTTSYRFSNETETVEKNINLVDLTNFKFIN